MYAILKDDEFLLLRIDSSQEKVFLRGYCLSVGC